MLVNIIKIKLCLWSFPVSLLNQPSRVMHCHMCVHIYLWCLWKRGKGREEGREGGGSDPELSSCDSFSIQSEHHRTISDLIKQTGKEWGREEKERNREERWGEERESNAGEQDMVDWSKASEEKKGENGIQRNRKQQREGGNERL